MVVRISKDRVDIGSEKFENAQLQNYTETVVTANSGTAYTIDLSQGNAFNITLTGNCTFSIINAPASGIAGYFTLTLAQDQTGGKVVTWPSAVIWPNNTPPNISLSSYTVSLYKFFTVTGSTYWYGVQTGRFSSSGTMWGWGYNGTGSMGDGTALNRSSPIQIGSLATWSSIGAGDRHAIAVKTDGTLWAWGYDAFGQLGLSDSSNNRSSPVQIGSLTTWASVMYGNECRQSLAVKTDGTLWAWGYNNKGQLGLQDTANRSSPVQVGALTNWFSVAAGGYNGQYNTLAIKTDGTLWAWGYNNHGQLGVATNAGTVTGVSSPVQVGALTNWVKVVTNGDHTLAIKTDGTLWAWGYNGQGQLGLGSTTDASSPVQVGAGTSWTAIAVGRLCSLAVTSDGKLWSWGDNTHGELGQRNTTSLSSPTQVGVLTTWASVAAGRNHSLALTSTGQLFAWGYRANGDIGDGANVSRSSPVAIGSSTAWTSLQAGRYTSYALQLNKFN